MPPSAEYSPYAPPQAEQQPFVEEGNIGEILTPQFRQELADLGFVSILDEAFTQPQETADGPIGGEPLSSDEQAWEEELHEAWPDDSEARLFEAASGNNHGAAMLLLLERALRRIKALEDMRTNGGQEQAAGPKKRKRKPPYKDPYYDVDYWAQQNIYAPRKQNTDAPRPDFVPAASMGAEQGPHLPNLSYNDRVRPGDRQPSQADFAAADRASEMLRDSLWKAGWRGGETTPEQMKAAHRNMIRDFHPDRTPGADADHEAFKQYLSSDDHTEKRGRAQRTEPEAAPTQSAQPEENSSQEQAPRTGPAPEANSSAEAPTAIEPEKTAAPTTEPQALPTASNNASNTASSGGRPTTDE